MVEEEPYRSVDPSKIQLNIYDEPKKSKSLHQSQKVLPPLDKAISSSVKKQVIHDRRKHENAEKVKMTKAN